MTFVLNNALKLAEYQHVYSNVFKCNPTLKYDKIVVIVSPVAPYISNFTYEICEIAACCDTCSCP